MAEEESKSVYEMELHEVVQIGKGFSVIRVPGGWIYKYVQSLNDGFDTISQSVSTTFVPLDKEGSRTTHISKPGKPKGLNFG